MCVDYRAVNRMTKPMFYPTRSVDEILYRIAAATILSILDMTQGYMQVPMDLPSQPYTAFSTHLGSFAFARMSFGLRNAAFTLSMLMDIVFKDLRSHTENYHDDIYTYSESIESHFDHLSATLQAIISANIQVSAEKTKLFVTQAHILGHIVGQGQIKPDFDKTEDIANMPPPKNRTGVRSFLGMVSYFRKFIPNFAKIAGPLTKLTSEATPWCWTTDQESSFQTLKAKLTEKPVLKAPDFELPWYLLTDASSGAIGSWLAQRHDGHLHPVAYHSRQLKPHELKWCLDPYEAEVLAIYDSLRKFKHFLYGARLIILSDSQALQWLFSRSQFKSPRLTRWALSIQCFGADILHLPGTLNRPADTLSRYPIHHLIPQDPTEQLDTTTAHGAPHRFNSLGKYPPNRLEIINDPTDRQAITQADFLVDGDPTQDEQPSLTLLSCTELPTRKQLPQPKININSIRTNEPDLEDPENTILWTEAELKKSQAADPLIRDIIKYVKNPTDLHRQLVDPNIQDLDTFIVDNTGILYKKQQDPSAELRGEEEVLCVPHALQRRAIESIHNSAVAGHPGPQRSCWAAHRRFWWRNMDRDVKKYADSCKSCHQFKGSAHPRVATRRYPVPPAPWHTVSVDLVGRLPTTKEGNKFILVCVDHLTRYTVAVPIKAKSSIEVAKSLTKIFCEHGFPVTLLSDNGTEFNNSLVKDLSRLMGFRHKTIVAYHPASQGLVERKNGTLMVALRQLYHERPDDWDGCLQWAQHAINSAYCVSIGDTPFFAFKHRDADLPLHVTASPATNSKTPKQAITDEKERAKATYDIMKAKLLESADQSARTLQKKSRACKIQVDDRVFIRYIKNKKGDNKLSPRFSGPFRVVSQKSPHTFKLKNLTNNRIIEAHVENMKLVKEDTAPLEMFPNARLPLQDLHPSQQPQDSDPESSPNSHSVPVDVQPQSSTQQDPPSDPDDQIDNYDFLGF